MKKLLFIVILFLSVSVSYSQIFGGMDDTFDNGSGTDNTVHAVALQSDGKILVAGDFSSYNGIATGKVIRLNTDGSHDNTFVTTTNDQVFCVAVQNDGKIIIGGTFSQVNGVPARRVARLNSDGSLDNAFTTGTGNFNCDILSLAVLFDGTIVCGGDITLFNDVPMANIVKLNSSGNLVTGSYGTNEDVTDIGVQTDGKIVICGKFTQYNGVTRNRITRLNTDLSLDASFDVGTGADNRVFKVAIQEDQKILLFGAYTTFNGVNKPSLIRLNTDGSIDNTFDAGPNQIITSDYSVTLMNNDKIVLGGDFTSLNGTPINRIAVLNTDGSIDNSFNPGLGANSAVVALSIQNDGKILIGGYFTSYDGTSRRGITRLNGESTSNVSQLDTFKEIQLQPNPTNGVLKVSTSIPTSAFITSANGAILKNLELSGETTIEVSTFAPGIYFVSTAEGQTVKFIKE
jgi:uncharacterized delta-60 repeat protein